MEGDNLEENINLNDNILINNTEQENNILGEGVDPPKKISEGKGGQQPSFGIFPIPITNGKDEQPKGTLNDIINYGKDFAASYQQGANKDLKIDLNDYKDVIGSNLGFITDKESLDKTRAERQSNWRQFGNAVARTALNVVPEIVAQTANIFDLEDYYNTDNEVGNYVARAVKDIQNSTNKEFPIYRENPNKPLDFGDAAYWFENGSDIVTSAAAFVAVGAATGSVSLSAVTKGAKALQWLKGIEAAEGVLEGSKAVRAISSIASSTLLNQAESVGIGTNVFDISYKAELDRLKGSEEGANLSDDEISNKAKQVAASKASQAINFNRLNILLNLTSAGMLLKNNVSGTRNILTKPSLGKALFTAAEEGVQEYGEETINDIGEQRAYADKYTFKDGLDRVLSAQGFEAGFLGFLGGAGQTALTKAGKYLPIYKNTEYNNEYINKYNQLKNENTLIDKEIKNNLSKEVLSDEEIDAEAKKYAAEKVGITKNNISDNQRETQAYNKQQYALSQQNQLIGVDKLTDTIASLKNAEESTILFQELDKARKEGDNVKTNSLESSLLSHQAFNAFETGTTDNLENTYKGVLELTNEQAAEKGIYQEGDDNTPNYFKTKMKSALEQILTLEKEYNNSQNYLNNYEVYHNRVNSLENKKGLDSTQTQFNDLLAEYTDLYKDKEGFVPAIDMNNIGYINIINSPFGKTNEYKKLRSLKRAYNLYNNNLIKLQTDYNNITSKDYQTSLKAVIEKVRKENQNKVEKEAVNKKINDNRKESNGFINKLKTKLNQKVSENTDVNTIKNTKDSSEEVNTDVDTNTNSIVEPNVDTSSPSRNSVSEQPTNTSNVNIQTQLPMTGNPTLDNIFTTYNSTFSGDSSTELKKQAANKVLSNLNNFVAVNPTIVSQLPAIKAAAESILAEINDHTNKQDNTQYVLKQQKEELVSDLEADFADSPDTEVQDEFEKAKERTSKLIDILRTLKEQGVDTSNLKEVVQAFEDDIDKTRVQSIFTPLKGLFMAITGQDINDTYEELMYDIPKTAKIIKNNEDIKTFSLPSELYTSDHDDISKSSLENLNTLANLNNLDGRDSGFEFDSLGYRGEVGHNKLAYLARQYTTVFKPFVTDSGLPYIAVTKGDLNNLLNSNLSQKVIDGTIKVGSDITFVPLEEVELQDGSVLKASNTGINDAPIGVMIDGELIDGLFLHDVNWINTTNLNNTKDNIVLDQNNLIKLRDYILNEGINGVDTKITAIGPGVPIIDVTGEFNTISENMPDVILGVIKNSRVQIDNNNSTEVVNEVLPREGTNVAVITLGDGRKSAIQLKRTKLSDTYINSIIKAIDAYISQIPTGYTEQIKKVYEIDLLRSEGIEKYLTKFIYGFNKSLPTTEDFEHYLNNVKDGISITHFKSGEIRFGEGQGINIGVIKKDKTLSLESRQNLLNDFRKHLSNLYTNINIGLKGTKFSLPIISDNGKVNSQYDNYEDFIKDNLLTNNLSFKLDNGKTIYTIQSSIEFNPNFNKDVKPTELFDVSLTGISTGKELKYIENETKYGNELDDITEEFDSPDIEYTPKYIYDNEDDVPFDIEEKNIKTGTIIQIKDKLYKVYNQEDEDLDWTLINTNKNSLSQDNINNNLKAVFTLIPKVSIANQLNLVKSIITDLYQDLTDNTPYKNNYTVDISKAVDLKLEALKLVKEKYIAANHPQVENISQQIDSIVENKSLLLKTVERRFNKLNNIKNIKAIDNSNDDKNEDDTNDFDSDEVITEDNRNTYLDTALYTIDPKTSLRSTIQKLLNDIVDYKILYKNGQETLVERKNQFLDNVYVGENIVYNKLMSILATNGNSYIYPTYENYKAALESKVKDIPFLYDIIEKLEHSSEDVKNAFVTGFSKHATQHIFMQESFNTSDKSYSLRSTLSNSNKLSDVVVSEWQNNLRTKNILLAKDNIVAFNPKALEVFNTIYNGIKNGTVNLDYQSFNTMFGAIGIEIPTELYQKFANEGISRKESKLTLKQSFDNSGGLIKIIKDRIDKFSNKNILIGENKEIDLDKMNLYSDKAFKDLSKMIAEYKTDITSNSFKDGKGNNIYAYNNSKYVVDRFGQLKTDLQLLNNLQIDPFTKDSLWLNQLLKTNTDNTTEINKESIFFKNFNYNTADSFKVNGKTKMVDELDFGEFEKMRLSYYMNRGNRVAKTTPIMQFLYPTMSDKSTMFIIQAPGYNFELINGKLKDSDMEFLLDTLVMPEINRIKQYQLNPSNVNISEYKQGANKFLLFPAFNDEITLWNVDEKGNNIELRSEIGDTQDSRNLLKTILRKYINSEVIAKKDKWTNYNILDENTKIKYIDTDYKNVYGEDVNHLLRNYVLNNMIALMNIQQLFIGDPSIFSKGNSNSNDFAYKTNENQLKRLAGNNAAKNNIIGDKNERFNLLVIKDREIASNNLEQLKEWKVAKGYENINATDAQEYTTLEEDLRVQFKEGTITKDAMDEILYRHKTDKDLNLKELGVVVGPRKPVYYNNYLRDNIMSNLYVKSSSIPLTNELVSGSPMEVLKRFMEVNNIDRVAFESAVKVGKPTKVIDIFKQDGSIVIPDNWKDSLLEVPREGHGIQQQVPYNSYANTINYGSQRSKLLFNNLHNVEGFINPITGETTNGKQLAEDYKKQWKDLYKLNHDNLIKELNFNKENGTIDIRKLEAIIIKEAVGRNYNPNDLAALKIDLKNNNFEVPLWMGGNASKVNALTNSIVDNRIRKIKVKGKSFVLVSEEGHQRNQVKTLDEVNKSQLITLKDWNGKLNTTIEKDGTISYAEVLIPFKFWDNKGEPLNYKDFIKEDNSIDTDKLSSELLEIFGFRIPTQGLNSMSMIKVVGFIPEGMGDIMIASKDFVTQMGSDFDVDKLYTQMYNTYYSPNTGKISAINEETIKNNLKLFKGQDMLLQNNILRFTKAVFNNPALEVQQQRAKALGFDTLSSLSKNIYKEQDLSKWTPLSEDFQSYRYLSARAGKSLVGAFSLDSVFNSSLQEVSEPVTFMSTIWEGEKARKVPYKINITGIENNNLNNNVDKNGNYKSDNISEIQSAALDDTKEQLLYKLNINNKTNDAIRALLQLGFPLDITMTLVNQPIIKSFVKGISIKEGIDKELSQQDKLLISNTSLKEMKEFIQDDIKDTEYQEAIYRLFTELTKKGKQLKTIQSIINTDSAGIGKNSFYSIEKSKAIAKLYTKSNISNIEKLIGNYETANYPVRMDKDNWDARVKEAIENEGAILFKNILITPTTINGYASVYANLFNTELWTNYFPYDKGELGDILNKIVDTSNDDSSLNRRAELLQKAFLEYKGYLTSNTYKIFNSYNTIKNAKEDLLLDTNTHMSLGTIIADIKSKNKIINPFIDRIQIGSTNQTIDTSGKVPTVISFINANTQELEEDIIIDSIIDMIINPKSLGEYNGKELNTKQLVNSLIIQQAITGGVQRGTQLIKYIPIQYLKDLGYFDNINETFNTINRVDAATQYSRFLTQYIQHNPDSFYNPTIDNAVEKVENGIVIFKDNINSSFYPSIFTLPSSNIHKGYDIFKDYNGTYIQIDTLGNNQMNEYDLNSEFAGKSIIYANTAVDNNYLFSNNDTNFFPHTTKVSEGYIPENSDEINNFLSVDKGLNGIATHNDSPSLIDKYDLNYDGRIDDKYNLILRNIINNTNDPILEYTAKKLMTIIPSLNNVPININTSLSSKGRAYISNLKGNPIKIEINPSKINSEDELQRVIVEEIIHSTLIEEIKKDNIHSKRLKELYEDTKKELINKYGQEAFNKVQDKVKNKQKLNQGTERDLLYNVLNVDEFIANAITNPIFQKYLNESKHDKSSLWKRFINRIKNILVSLGVIEDSKLESILHEVIQVFEKKNKETYKEATTPKYERTIDFIQSKFQLVTNEGELIEKKNAQDIVDFINNNIINIEASKVDNFVSLSYKNYNNLSIADSIDVEDKKEGYYKVYLDTINYRMKQLKANLNKAIQENNYSKIASLEADIREERNKLKRVVDIKNLVDLAAEGDQELARITDILKRPMNEEDILFVQSTVGFWKKAKEFVFEAKHFTSENLGNIYGNIERKAQDLHLKLVEIEKKYLEDYIKTKTGKDITISDIFDNYKDISTIKSYLQDISTADNTLLSSIFIDVKQANIDAEDEGNIKLKEIEEVTDKILPILKGINSKNPFDVFAQKDSKGRMNGHIVKSYSHLFYREKAKKLNAINNENNAVNFKKLVDWYESNTENLKLEDYFTLTGETTEDIDNNREKLKKQIGDYNYNNYINKQEKNIQRYEQARQGQIEYLMTKYSLKNPTDINETIHANKQYSEWIHKNSPFKLAYFIKNALPNYISNYKDFNSFKYYETIPKKLNKDGKDFGYYDKDFKQIENNTELLSFYNLYNNIITDLSKYLSDEQRQQLAYNGVPEIEKTIIELFSESGMKVGYKSIRDALAKSVQSKYNTNSVANVDPLTQKPLREMRVSTIKNHFNEIQDYVNRKAADYILKENKPATPELLEEWRLDKLSKIAQNNSFDLPKILKVFTVGALAYKHKSKIENKVKIAKSVIDTMQEAQLRGDGTPIVIAGSGDIYKKAAEESFGNTKNALEHFINLNFYNDSKNEEGLGSKIYTKTEKEQLDEINNLLENLDKQYKSNEIDEEMYNNYKNTLETQKKNIGSQRVYSKYGDNALRYFQLLGMGWNVLGGIANAGFGFISNAIEGAGGELYTSAQINQAYKLVSASFLKNITFENVKIGDAVKIRSLMDNFNILKDATHELFNDTNENAILKKFKSLSPYTIYQRTEYINQAPVMIAMLMNTEIDTPNGKSNLYEAFDENGKWNNEYGEYPKETIDKARLKIDQAIAKRIHGNYDPVSSTVIKRNILGRAIIQFRSWLVDAVVTRFGKERTDDVLGMNVKGRYVSLWDNKGKLDTWSELLKSMVRQGTFGTVFKNSDFSNIDLSDTDKANMRRLSMEILLAINVQLTLIALTSLLKGDDDDENYAYNALFNQGLRLRTDLLLYVNPSEGRKLFKDIIPALSLLDNAKKWTIATGQAVTGNDEYQTGEYAGDSRFVRTSAGILPVVNQAYRVYSSSIQTNN